MAADHAPVPVQTKAYLRHTWPVRLMHWVNALAFVLLLMSGLQIFNAHPALYWGKSSYDGRPPVLQIHAQSGPDGQPQGVTRAFGQAFHTTGVLGFSDGSARAFPAWITLPGPQWLAMGRRWHLFFAWVLVINGIAYIAYTVASRHLVLDLVPSRADWRGFGRTFKDHLLLRRARGDAARRYNVLQKLSYLGVIFVLFPLLILMGWAMSPALNAVAPGWVDVFGGRQAARTLHFAVAWLLVAFVFVHVFEVIVNGFWNSLRAMITGRYRVDEDAHD